MKRLCDGDVKIVRETLSEFSLFLCSLSQAFLTEKSVQKVPLFKSGMPLLINFCPLIFNRNKVPLFRKVLLCTPEPKE